MRETAAITPAKRRQLEQGCSICGRNVVADGFCRRHAPLGPTTPQPTPRPARQREKYRSIAEQPNRRLKAVYRYIVEYKIANDGNGPSLREIGNACAIPSVGVVAYYLDKLHAAELILFDELGNNRLIVAAGRWVYEGAPITDPTLKLIVDYKLDHNGNSPALDWLAAELGLVKSGVHGRLVKLEAAGLLRRLKKGATQKGMALVIEGGRFIYEGGQS